MDNKEVLELIGAMNDYADKKNNQGLKNTLLVLLLSLVCSIVAGVIGYGWKEIVGLREAKEEMKEKLTRIETKLDISVKEQNKVVFSIAEALAHFEAEKAVEPVKPDKPDWPLPLPQPPKPEKEPKKKPTAEKFFPKNIEDDKKFKEYHEHFEQRIQSKLPPQSMER